MPRRNTHPALEQGGGAYMGNSLDAAQRIAGWASFTWEQKRYLALWGLIGWQNLTLKALNRSSAWLGKQRKANSAFSDASREDRQWNLGDLVFDAMDEIYPLAYQTLVDIMVNGSENGKIRAAHEVFEIHKWMRKTGGQSASDQPELLNPTMLRESLGVKATSAAELSTMGEFGDEVQKQREKGRYKRNGGEETQ